MRSGMINFSPAKHTQVFNSLCEILRVEGKEVQTFNSLYETPEPYHQPYILKPSTKPPEPTRTLMNYAQKSSVALHNKKKGV